MTIKTCYATCSIGVGTNPPPSLPARLEAISKAGFDSIELSFPDIQEFANQKFNAKVAEDDYDRLCEATRDIAQMCQKLGLEVAMLQPFANFEGWPRGSQEREDAFERARGWIRIMEAAGTRMLQVGSTDSPNITSSEQDIITDLRDLADLLRPKAFRLAYENWCWATHAPTWRSVWTIVNKVDRANVGLCLDTFQTAGSEWADPTTASGLEQVDGHDGAVALLDARLDKSLAALKREIPGDKIYILQVSDAYRMDPPLEDRVDGDGDGLRPKGRWSHDYRPLPFDGGYLPVSRIADAIIGTGYEGYLSIEVFDSKEEEKFGGDLGRVAQAGMGACRKLLGKSG